MYLGMNFYIIYLGMIVTDLSNFVTKESQATQKAWWDCGQKQTILFKKCLV